MNTDVMPHPLCLYLLHWQGQAVEHAWHWPETADVVHLDELMRSAGLSVPADMQADAKHWTVRRDLKDPQNHWQFSHQCNSLQCTHNGKIFPRGQRVALQDGDLMEAGLCRLALLNPQTRQPLQPSNQPVDDESLNDLTRLAQQHAPSWLNHTTAQPSDLHLFELLGQAPSSHDQGKASTQSTETQSEPWHIDVDLKDGELQPDPLLQSLHTAYLQYLQDPLSSPQQDDWAVTQLLSKTYTDPLAELKQRGQDKTTLSDLLGLHDGIEQVIEQLQSQGPIDILTPTKPDNVMHLFAPQAWQDKHPRQVPAVNQQDHHGLALDSAMPWHLAHTPKTTP